MNISEDKVEKQMINSVWSVSTSTKDWPVRVNRPFLRFYSNPKTGRSYINRTKVQPQIKSVLDAVVLSERNNISGKQSSLNITHRDTCQSSTAFCSTSKVKRTPLAGVFYDEFVRFPWNISKSDLLPLISRPTSKPIIFHGKRYTMIALEDDILHNMVLHQNKDWSKVSQHIDYNSEQRRRFYEAEQNKWNTRIHKNNVEASDQFVRRSCYLSGRRIAIRASMESTDERLSQPEKRLSGQSFVRKEEEIKITKERDIEDCDRGRIPDYDRNDSGISGNTASNGLTEIEITRIKSKLTDIVKSAIKTVEEVSIDSASFIRANERILEIITKEMEEIQHHSSDRDTLGINTIEDSWRFFAPKERNDIEDLKTCLSIEPNSLTLATSIVEGEANQRKAYYQCKISSLMKVQTIDPSLSNNITFLIQLFPSNGTEPSLAKVYFWMKLFAMLLGQGNELNPTLSNYLGTLVKIIANKHTINQEIEGRIVESLKRFVFGDEHMTHIINGSFKYEDDSEDTTVPWTHLIDTVRWVLITHRNIFNRPLTINNVAVAMATIFDRPEE